MVNKRQPLLHTAFQELLVAAESKTLERFQNELKTAPPRAPPSTAAPSRPGAPISGAWSNSVAVLPFADLSAQKNQDYLCDWMTEDIIGQLSRISDLKVISRTSVVFYKNTQKTVREIARELGVAHVLEGSIQREGEAIRSMLSSSMRKAVFKSGRQNTTGSWRASFRSRMKSPRPSPMR